MKQVGDQVHYYGRDTLWHQSRLVHPMNPEEAQLAETFIGPFAATVVFVHKNGCLNLNILYPSPCYFSAEKSGLVENVRYADPPKPGCWHER